MVWSTQQRVSLSLKSRDVSLRCFGCRRYSLIQTAGYGFNLIKPAYDFVAAYEDAIGYSLSAAYIHGEEGQEILEGADPPSRRISDMV